MKLSFSRRRLLKFFAGLFFLSTTNLTQASNQKSPPSLLMENARLLGSLALEDGSYRKLMHLNSIKTLSNELLKTQPYGISGEIQAQIMKEFSSGQTIILKGFIYTPLEILVCLTAIDLDKKS